MGNYIYNSPFARPSYWGVNGGVNSDLASLAFKNIEQLEYFHSRILILQQEIILTGETLSSLPVHEGIVK